MSPKTILIVDDSVFDRALLLKALNIKGGFKTLEASSAVQCLVLLEEQKVDLILMDIMMPGIQGNKTLEKIRKKFNQVELPIIMVTAKTESNDIVDSLREGANDYITKPVNFEVALSKISTHLKLTELSNELVKARLKESSRLASLGEMAAGIAHEINNPLSVILGRSSKLLDKVKTDQIEKQYFEESLNTVINTASRIAEIVKGLRAVAKGDSDERMSNNKIRTLVDQTVMFCNERFRANDINLTVTGETGNETLCYPVQISQVVINLLNNAFEAVKLLPERWVRVQIEQTLPITVIKVVDSGKGIPENITEKIMEPFFSTKPVGQGSGLGLSISKGLVELNGGRFYYDNSMKNTCFVIEIPNIVQQPKKQQ